MNNFNYKVSIYVIGCNILGTFAMVGVLNFCLSKGFQIGADEVSALLAYDPVSRRSFLIFLRNIVLYSLRDQRAEKFILFCVNCYRNCHTM